MKKIISIVILFIFMFCLNACNKESSSIGFIGGADGPTAIFVSSNISWLHIFGLIGIIVAAVLVAFVIYQNKKKK